MLLKITNTQYPASDLGFLLHKHPDKFQTVELSFGNAHIFYSDASDNNTTACLLLDINPISLVRGGKEKRNAPYIQEQYVNEKPYTCNSFMATAIVKAFGSALNGTCKNHQELVEKPLLLKAELSSLKLDCDISYIDKLLTPLGYKFTIELFDLDSSFPEWGNCKNLNLTIEKQTTLKEILSILYVLIIALDGNRSDWVTENDIEILLKRGEPWLGIHPEKEWIVKRYLKNLKTLKYQALNRLESPVEISEENTEKHAVINLHNQRLQKAFELLKASGAKSVLDIGCGEGKLLRLLLRDSQFSKIAGTDVSYAELQKARENLYLNDASPLLKERIQLFQSSATYLDERFKNYDALCLVEVIEHIDEERLLALERILFKYCSPDIVIISTPNSEYNTAYTKLQPDSFRHDDHRFEWTRKQFHDWCSNIASTYDYQFRIEGIGESMDNIGTPSQISIFNKINNIN